MPPQLEMKVKYLLYLLRQPDYLKKPHIIQEMRKELREREAINGQLFEDTKFSLLKVYSNLRSLRKRLKRQRESIRSASEKLQLVARSEAFQLGLCVTSRASRNIEGEEKGEDQYRYRLASADEILVERTEECIHKENCFTGLGSHGDTIVKVIQVFAKLSEVKYFLHYPAFTSFQQNHYGYCSEVKIGEALRAIMSFFKKEMQVKEEEQVVFEGIIFRLLN